MMLSEAWVRIFKLIKNRKCNIEVMINHLLYSDMIPMNLTFYTDQLTKLIRDKIEKSDQSINLSEYEFKDILDHRLNVINSNVKHNERIKLEIEKLLENKSKITKETIVLKNRLKVLTKLKQCKEIFFCKDSVAIKYDELYRIYNEMTLCGYGGQFCSLILNEFSKYRVLKGNLKVVIESTKTKDS